MLEAVPAEVRACPQWLAWQYQWNAERNKWDKIPLSCATGRKCDVTSAASWTTFDNACGYARQHVAHNIGVGFVVGYNSGIVGIDFDGVFDGSGNVVVPNLANAAWTMDSYTERSPSGLGLHVLVKADFPRGLRSNGVELYGVARFLTMTGNVAHPDRASLQTRQYAVEKLAEAIEAERSKAAPTFINWSAPDKFTDNEIGQQASNAENGAKFLELWNGQWQHHYTSQSEADFALVNILGFYSDSPQQIRRMFRNSALGQRAKAMRDAYLNGVISRSQDRKPPMVEIPALLHVSTGKSEHVDVPLVDNVQMHDEYLDAENIYEVEGGFVKELSDYVYAQSIYPMRELATISALGIMAGICGRQYQLDGSGLNLYFMFLAVTGEGKDAMSQSVEKIFQAVTKAPPVHTAVTHGVELGFPAADDFHSQADMTGKGLQRLFAESKTSSVVTVWTEFSRYMARMASPTPDAGTEAFQDALLKLYNKSAKGSTWGGAKNADKSADLGKVESPSLTLIAEGTPYKFYTSLSEAMITEGLLSRFMIVERMTDAPHNPAYKQFVEVPANIKQGVTNYCKHVLTLRTSGDYRIDVAWEPAAEAYSFKLSQELRGRGGRKVDDVTGSLWRRAHQNITRIAALIAIGINPTHPTISIEQLLWAQRIVERTVKLVIDRFKRGETGVQDSLEAEQLACLNGLLDRWLATMPETFSQAEKPFAEARAAGVMPAQYIMTRCYSVACFIKGKPSRKIAFDNAVKQLQAVGRLSIVNVPGKTGTFYKVSS